MGPGEESHGRTVQTRFRLLENGVDDDQVQKNKYV
jgi:hypothetical protein